MSTEITINQDIVEINVTEEVVVIEAPSGAYPLPSMVSSVFGRTGNVVAQEGDYNLTQLGDVTISTPSNGQVLRYNGTTWVNATESFAGTVTSVDMSVPTGLTISGNPITTSGTLAVGLGAGYVIPTQAALDAKQDDLNGTGIVKSTAGTITYLSDNTANWNTAYNDSIVSASVTGTATKTLTLNQQDGGSVTASWTDTDTGLTSVGLSMPSAFSVANSPLTANGTLSVTGAGTTLEYVRGDGSLATFPSLTGFVPYTGATTNVNLGTHSLTAYDLIINHTSGSGVAASITKGGNGEALTVVKSSGSGNAASITGGVTLLDELHLTTDLADAYIASAATWNAKQNAITLTTTGTSGAATLVGATLNIPQYQGVLTNPVTGTGTTNTLPKFTGASTIGNSNITDSGTLITLGSNSFVNGNLAVGANSAPFGERLYIQGDASASRLVLTTSANSGISTLSVNVDRGLQGGVDIVADKTNQIGRIQVTNSSFWPLVFQVRGSDGINERMRINATGSVGIGTTSPSTYSLAVAKNMTGGTIAYGIGSYGTIQSDVTSGANGFISGLVTAAASFTLTNYRHFYANQGTIGAGSVVTNQTAFFVDSNVIGATNNFAFRSIIPAGTNRWNIYMDGTAANYMAGVLNIGTTTLSGFSLDVNGTARVQSTLISGGGTPLVLTGESFALQAISAGLPSGAVFGTNVANNPSFINILSGNNFWHISNRSSTNANRLGIFNASFTGTTATYSSELLTISTTGSVGIGSTSLTGFSLRVAKNITGSTSGIGISQGGVIQSDVTSGWGYYNSLTTAAATFTIGTYRHYFTEQGTLGAGSVITIQTGFEAGSSLIGGTNNYGFRGAIPAGTNRWNLYMDGNANNYLAGSLGIGTTSLTGINLRVGKTITGSTLSYGIYCDTIVQSDVTSAGIYYGTRASTAAATFTLGSLTHYNIDQLAFGAGSTVTNQYGFLVNSSMTGATNNYGFYGNIASGTNRWNLYMAGTAANYMAGTLSIGTTSLTEFVNIANSTNGVTRVTTTNSNAGTATQVQYQLSNGTHSAGFGLTGSAFTSSGVFLQGGAYLSSGNSAGGLLLNTGAAQPIYFGISNTERARLDVNGNFGVGTNASNNASAKVQIDSTTQGFLPPRMTTTQKLAIGTPAAGLMVYDTTLNQMSYYNGTLWINF